MLNDLKKKLEQHADSDKPPASEVLPLLNRIGRVSIEGGQSITNMSEVLDALVKRLPMFTYCGIRQENKFTALVSLISGFQLGLAKAGDSKASDELLPAGFVDRVGRHYGISLTSVAEAFKEIAIREENEERAYQRLLQLLRRI